jgi:hypothetical protein
MKEMHDKIQVDGKGKVKNAQNGDIIRRANREGGRVEKKSL